MAKRHLQVQFFGKGVIISAASNEMDHFICNYPPHLGLETVGAMTDVLNAVVRAVVDRETDAWANKCNECTYKMDDEDCADGAPLQNDEEYRAKLDGVDALIDETEREAAARYAPADAEQEE